MILAAGRGERMRPLSDATPKPLLRAGGKPLIVWQIEALARAGFRDIVINVAHRGRDLIDAPDGSSRVHLVMVPNPPWHAAGDFALAGEHVELDGAERLTFGNIGVYDTALFRDLPRGVKLKMLPLYRDWIGRGIVSGERYDGPWANVGTPADLAAVDA